MKKGVHTEVIVLKCMYIDSLVYFIIGLIMFNYFEKIAMKKGIQS